MKTTTKVEQPKPIWKMDIGAMHGGISSRTVEERAKLIRYRPPQDLLQLMHPINQRIYGKAVLDEPFLKSIREDGVVEPIVICLATVPHYAKRDGGRRGQLEYVISGHRRLAAAIQVGLKKVPVRVMSEDYTSEAQVEKYLILYNQQRVKTPEQRGREFTELKRIESALAKERQGARTDLKANLPEGPKGQARDAAAKAIGVGARTAEKIEKIVQKADSGDSNARTVLDALNAGTKSTDAAYKEVVRAPKNPEAIAALEKHVAKARELTELFLNLNFGEVVRSAKADRFHLTLRNLTEEQVREYACK